jgi:hypothetical protein
VFFITSLYRLDSSRRLRYSEIGGGRSVDVVCEVSERADLGVSVFDIFSTKTIRRQLLVI